jgi:hypothetical protein
MAVYTIETPDGKVFDIEGDVAPTEEQINQIVQQMNGTSNMVPVPVEDNSASIDAEEQYRQALRAEKERREGWSGNLQALAGSALSSFSWGASDLGYRAGFGKDAANEQRIIRESNPFYSAVGTVLGFVPGLAFGPISWAATGLTKAATSLVAKKAGEAGMKKVAQIAAGKAATTATKIVAEGVIGEAQFQLQQTAEKLAGTRDFAEGSNFLEGAAFSIAADAAMRTIPVVGRPIANLISKRRKAINAMGGVDNIKRAQGDYIKALDSGRTAEEAEAIFNASLMQGIPDKDRALYEHLVQKDPELAKFARQQMAGGGELVVETASALTAQQYKKYSQGILENLYGPEYKNILGTTEIDFSKEGLKDLLGTSNQSAVMEVRKQGLARAEEKVMSNPSLAKEVSDKFTMASNNLMMSGSRDLQRAANMVEPASIKSYVGSDAYQEAVQAADEAINNAAQQLAEAGQQITQAQITDITMQAHRSGSQKHFKKLMSEGTDSVQDINDIKEFFKSVDEKAVAAGQAEAFGAFNETINKQILDGLDDALYQTNQALRYEKTLTDMHEFGKKFDQTKINELQSKLNNGLSAEEKAMKMAAFKMGVLEDLNDAVISGNRNKFEQLQAMFKSQKSLGQFFEPEEISKYMDAIRPKAEAAHNLNRILHAAGKYSGDQGVLAPAVRLVTGVATGARQQWNNAAITLLQRGTYGKGTSKMIQEFTKNPTSANLNRMLKSASDLTERQQMVRSLADAFDAVTDVQTLVRGMRDLQER